jgi:lipoyl-dependent peroxiredoxin
MKPLYEGQATAIGGRTGVAATPDGRLRLTLSLPEELGGDGGEGTNPEQLFAMAYASCFLEAIKRVADASKTEIAVDSNVTATVGIGPRDDGKGMTLIASLLIDLPGLDQKVAEDLVGRAHLVCPYSEATKTNLNVDIRVT